MHNEHEVRNQYLDELMKHARSKMHEQVKAKYAPQPSEQPEPDKTPEEPQSEEGGPDTDALEQVLAQMSGR